MGGIDKHFLNHFVPFHRAKAVMTKPILVKKSGWGWCIVWAVALSGNATRAPYWRHSRFSILLSRIIAVLSQMQNAFIKFALSAKFWRALRDPKAVYLPL